MKITIIAYILFFVRTNLRATGYWGGIGSEADEAFHAFGYFLLGLCRSDSDAEAAQIPCFH